LRAQEGREGGRRRRRRRKEEETEGEITSHVTSLVDIAQRKGY